MTTKVLTEDINSIVTSVWTPWTDGNIPTEKAVRDAIVAAWGGVSWIRASVITEQNDFTWALSPTPVEVFSHLIQKQNFSIGKPIIIESAIAINHSVSSPSWTNVSSFDFIIWGNNYNVNLWWWSNRFSTWTNESIWRIYRIIMTPINSTTLDVVISYVTYRWNIGSTSTWLLTFLDTWNYWRTYTFDIDDDLPVSLEVSAFNNTWQTNSFRLFTDYLLLSY